MIGELPEKALLKAALTQGAVGAGVLNPGTALPREWFCLQMAHHH